MAQTHADVPIKSPKRCSALVNRNVTEGDTRTSMRLEPEFWEVIRKICLREGIILKDIVERSVGKYPTGGRTSAVRRYILYYIMENTEAGKWPDSYPTATDV